MFDLFQFVNNDIGKWRKKYFDTNLENIIGDHDSDDHVSTKDTRKCDHDKNYRIKKFSH